MSDLISRQAVCKEIERFIGYLDEDMITRLKIAIKRLPAADRWIPVSERLPKIDISYPHQDVYLVQYDSGSMDVASWSNVNWFLPDHVTNPYWNCAQFAEVIAWKPLPEPYKEDNK